jgi:hypothetical protein
VTAAELDTFCGFTGSLPAADNEVSSYSSSNRTLIVEVDTGNDTIALDVGNITLSPAPDGNTSMTLYNATGNHTLFTAFVTNVPEGTYTITAYLQYVNESVDSVLNATNLSDLDATCSRVIVADLNEAGMPSPQVLAEAGIIPSDILKGKNMLIVIVLLVLGYYMLKKDD